jgi:RNA polymerase sigma-70 factor (sigma-E family)
VADDIITFGTRRRGADPGRNADVAIESLFHACYPRLVRTGYALVGDWDLAEQLAQEAYLRLWRRWRWISDPQAAPAYLQRTIVNLSRETIRRRMTERRALRAGGPRPADAHVPDAAALVELRRAVAALPARKRECVVLRYLLGLSEAETANALGISVGTVKSQTHKGLAQLKERLADTADGAGSADVADTARSPGGTAR